MGSKRFLRIGIASSVLAALSVLALIRFLLGLPIHFQWKLNFYSQFLFPVVARGAVFSFGLLGIPAYAWCWYRMIFRSQKYEARRLIPLVYGSYALCWLAVLVCYFPLILRDRLIVRGQLGQSEYEAGISALHQSFTLAASGAALLIIIYTLTALPVAALQRLLLLRFFKAQTKT
jgi:hypothetical protein